jgi:hypothetical protein
MSFEYDTITISCIYFFIEIGNIDTLTYQNSFLFSRNAQDWKHYYSPQEQKQSRNYKKYNKVGLWSNTNWSKIKEDNSNENIHELNPKQQALGLLSYEGDLLVIESGTKTNQNEYSKQNNERWQVYE